LQTPSRLSREESVESAGDIHIEEIKVAESVGEKQRTLSLGKIKLQA